jgi:hypothetical protein
VLLAQIVLLYPALCALRRTHFEKRIVNSGDANNNDDISHLDEAVLQVLHLNKMYILYSYSTPRKRFV